METYQQALIECYPTRLLKLTVGSAVIRRKIPHTLLAFLGGPICSCGMLFGPCPGRLVVHLGDNRYLSSNPACEVNRHTEYTQKADLYASLARQTLLLPGLELLRRCFVMNRQDNIGIKSENAERPMIT